MGPGEKLVRAAVRRPLLFFAGFALLALLAGAAESGWAVLRSKISEPSLGARWIWAHDAGRTGMPRTFYAARDFELPEGVERAWLSIAADETYVLWVNGRAVGSGFWNEGPPRHGKAADLYELSDWLERGKNRLVVELRSSSGAGGLLANLFLGDREQPVLRTDGDWRIFRKAEPRLLRGLAAIEEIEGGERPKLWQWPPTGRWRLDRVAARPDLRPEDPLHYRALCPRRLRFPGAGASWSELPASPACDAPDVSDLSLWDFGEVVDGVLEMGLDPFEEPLPALLHFFTEEPGHDLNQRRPEVILQAAPGAWSWRDSAVRRFRYLAIVGARPEAFLRVLPASAEQQKAYAPPAPPQGVFGLPAPAGSTPLERSIWDR